VSFAAAPAGGYVVDKWLLNSAVAQVSGKTFTVTDVSSAASVQVVFAPSVVLAPQLSGMGVSNGVFRFVLSGLPGSNYVVQVSSDLANWSPLSTNTVLPEGSVHVSDTSAVGQPRRFYRAATR
jgi:hypothetical protein